MTLFDRKQLQEVPCHITGNTFPTLLHTCQLEVHTCEHNCTSLHVDYDSKTCNFSEVNYYGIERTHTCYAHISFIDGVYGVIALSSGIGRYLCWVFTPLRLWVTSAKNCNQEAVQRMIEDPQAAITYDPVGAISLHE